MLASMARHGIDLGLVRRLPGVATSATILPIRPNGERPAWHVPGAAAVFTVAPEDQDAALDAAIVHVGGTGLLAHVRWRARAPRAGARQGAGAHHHLRSDPGDRGDLGLVEPLLPYVDYFLPSIEEASAMSGLSAPDEVARFFLDRGVEASAR